MNTFENAPLSYGQERMRLLNQMAPEASVGNVSFTYRITGDLDVDALGRAVDALVERHAILRTVHPFSGAQRIEAASGGRLTVSDLSGESDPEEVLARYVAAGVEEPFALHEEVPARWILFTVAANVHVLFLRLHHIATDGWSESIIHSELSALYGAFRAGLDSPLPGLSMSYADYAAEQRAEDQRDGLDFWREALAGAPTATAMPFDRPPTPDSGLTGRTSRMRVPREVADGVTRLARESRASVFMVCLAAFGALLARYDDQSDLVIGTPVAGRTRQELEGVVGFFVNTLPLRLDLSGDPSFRALLSRVRDVTLDGLEYADVPTDSIVAELRPGREPGREPLTQVFFQVHNTPVEAFTLDGLDVEQTQIFPGGSALDLSVTLLEEPDGLDGLWEYRTDLFDAATITRLQDQYVRLLAEAVATPDTPVRSLDMLSTVERERLVNGWNATTVDLSEATVVELFATRVAAHPDRIALVAGDERFTYAELDRRANRLAHRLAAEGVGTDDLVGILAERGPELVVAVLGVLKAGAAYLPLDPTMPAPRLAGMVADTRPRLILLGPGRADPFADDAPPRLRLGADLTGGYADTSPDVPVDPEQLAYVIFTSGSTGRPKGAAITHRGLANYLQWTLDAYDTTSPGGALLHSQLTFDFTVTPLFWPLLSGKEIVLVPEEDTLDRLADALRDTSRPLGLVKLTPAHLEALAARFGADERLTDVRTLVVGGEQLHGAKAAAWQRLLPKASIVNEYGPTETVVGCVVHTFAETDDPDRPVPIGSPIANMTAYLLDAELRPVPTGSSGELYLGGLGVSRGYVNRPGLTARVFVPDPFGVPGSRLYRTGDLARRRPDGVIEFLGRLDDQVKLRGYRIELGEIEATLRQDGNVERAVVCLREDTPGNPRLVGYYIPANASVTSAEISAELGRRLPAYMVPGALVALDALPVTRNGKVDRAALPVPDESPENAAEHVPPSTGMEQSVAEVWRELLGVNVGAHDSFFAIGGHSLVAARAASRIGTRHTIRTDRVLRALFAYPTLSAFSAEIERMAAEESTVERVDTITVSDRSTPFELPRGQERVWFLDQLDESGGEYEMPLALRLTGPLDVASLEAALAGIIERHDVLRTSVRVFEDRPLGVLRPAADFALEYVDLSDVPDPDTDALVAEHTGERLDLAEGLPIRARLLRLGPDDHLLCVTFHHMSFDGWSYHVFYEELAAGYRGRTPAPPPVAFHDLAAWQEANVAPEGMSYWRETLGDLTPFEVPTDRPRPARRHGLAHSTTFEVPRGVTEALERLAAGHDATMFMVLLAACQVLFHRHTGRTDVTVGTTAAERTRAESERLIGLFVNMLVLRGDVSGDPRFGDLIDRVRDMTVRAYAHQDTPFDQLVEELAPERDLSRTPLFGVMVKLNSQPLSAPTLPGLTVDEVAIPLAMTKYDVEVDFERVPEGLRCMVVGDTDLYEAGTVAGWAEHLATLLTELTADPDARIGQVPMLSAEEVVRQRELAGPPPSAYPNVGLHQLFEAQAASTPDLMAVVDDERAYTYAELDERAARIAASLVSHGVGPDVPVAVMLGRSADMLAGLLGVLKAGGAYVPIETDTPVARVGKLLAQARCPVVLGEPELADVVTAAGGVPLSIMDAVRADPLASPVVVHPDNLCAIYFTSGSTGQPKGVACTHGGWVNRMWWMQRRHDMRPGETVLHKTTLTFDDAAVELFWPLMVGGRVAMLAPGLHRDPRAIIDAAIACRSVHVNFVPSMLDLILSTVDEQDLVGLNGLRSVLSSGEALRPSLVARFLDRFGGRVSLDNTWGATEVSIDSTYRVCGPADASAQGVVSLGRAFDNNDVLVIDDQWRPLPVGVPGELAIGGVGLARCYLGDPARTAAAFVPHPHRPGERLYRTGDQGRMRADGSLEFMDRRDHQVKIRGVRIELGEVESVLREHPGVADAAVIAWQATPTDKRLAAYVVPTDSTTGVAELRGHAGEQLPSYAVPGSIILVDALPLLPSGKLDRKSLPAPDPETVRETAFRAPATVTEEAIAGIWVEVLGLRQVGADDNFFALGGHSLLATRIITRMRQAFGLPLPLSLIFERPTVATAAARVEELIFAEIDELSEEDALRLAAAGG